MHGSYLAQLFYRIIGWKRALLAITILMIYGTFIVYHWTEAPPTGRQPPQGPKDEPEDSVVVHVVRILHPPNWEELKRSFNVCLATQASLDKLQTIGKMAAYWRGPISLALLLRESDEVRIAQKFLAYMSACRELFRKTVTVTIALTNGLKEELGDEIPAFNFHGPASNCSSIKSPNLISASARNKVYSYPQNIMRNIARNNCQTDWTFIIDVDFVPKNNSAQALQAFYSSEEAKSCGRCAFVIPTFSMANCWHVPKTKDELINLLIEGELESYHVSDAPSAQYETNYARWIRTYTAEEPAHVSHSINYTITLPAVYKHIHFYEPFYISLNTIPLHDPRFVGFGSDRIAQTFEAFLAGWKFHVLTPIFAIHCARTPAMSIEKLKKTSRYSQQLRNIKHRDQFKVEVWNKYKKLQEIVNADTN